MATQAPDPKSFETWEEAFAYPIPVVRKFETQLRASISENRDKVRTLVGSSYRDLLGTADTIIEMSTTMTQLEDTVSSIGQRCNSRTLTKICSNASTLQQSQRASQVTSRRPKAELALQQACLQLARRQLHSPNETSNPLLTARLLLLSRLLQNTISRSSPNLLGSERLRLAPLRSRLLSTIDTKLADPDLSRAATIDLLLSYALITTSSLSDTARHFLSVRSSAISSLCASGSAPRRRDVTRALSLITATLAQAQSLFPSRMSDAMGRATASALLADGQVREGLSFELDVCERWIGKEVKAFVPFLRHADLSGEELQAQLGKWQREAVQVVLSGLERLLEGVKGPGKVVKVREKVVRHLLSAEVEGFERGQVLDRMRRQFNEKLEGLVSVKVGRLGDAVQRALKSGLTAEEVGSLWDAELGRMDLGRGAEKFRMQVTRRAEGRNDALVELEEAVQKWTEGLEGIRVVVKEMQSARWDDGLDDEDEEEEGKPGSRKEYADSLAKEDPINLAQHLQSEAGMALKEALDLLDAEVARLDPNANGDDQEARQNGSAAVYYLRVLHILSVAKQWRAAHSYSEEIATLAEKLNTSLALSIVGRLSAYQSPDSSEEDGPERLLFAEIPAAALWQGTPPLPVQTSPGIYRFLNDVCSFMNGVGGDVWSSAAVDATKKEIIQLVAKKSASFTNDPLPNSTAEARETDGVHAVHNGSGEETLSEDSASGARDGKSGTEASAGKNQSARLMQMLFDLLYLQQMLSLSNHSGGETLDERVESLRKKLEVGDAEFDRLVKSAAAYHRRSYLLFGALYRH